MSQEIEYLARQITGARFELLDLARRVAEAELELRRVRQARLLRQISPATRSSKNGRSPQSCKGDLPVLDPSDFFERYEERARSRRKFAIRDFDRARLDPR